jgi:hypothetical protein
MIYNSIIPPKGFKCINLFGIVFARKDVKVLQRDIHHEKIHTAQMKELLFIFFYIIYLTEYFIGLIKYKNKHDAYRGISFEVEAYEYQNKPTYLRSRKHFAQWKK